MNDLILADRELEVGFIGKLNALFEGIERMDASHKTSPSNEQFLTDKEVSAWLKVSRRTLQDYRNNGMIAYYQLGGKILYKESDIEKDGDERVSERLSSGNVNLNVQKQRKPMVRQFTCRHRLSLCNVISFTANTYIVGWLRTAKRTNLQAFHDLLCTAFP